MIYKKSSSPIAQNLLLLKNYYHVDTNKKLLKAIIDDLLVSIFLFSGTGLFTGVIKGLIGRLLIKSGSPLIIGKRAKIMHPSNMHFGHHVWIRDDVTLAANGKMKIGNDVVIGEKSTLWSDNKGLTIGDGVGIGRNCYIAQLGGPIIIGGGVLIADTVRIYSLNHKYEDTTKPILLQGYEESTIKIKDNVWIGSGAVIFNNVTVGTGSVIGANTVVTKNVPDYVVFAGVPGKVIKKLKRKK